MSASSRSKAFGFGVFLNVNFGLLVFGVSAWEFGVSDCNSGFLNLGVSGRDFLNFWMNALHVLYQWLCIPLRTTQNFWDILGLTQLAFCNLLFLIQEKMFPYITTANSTDINEHYLASKTENYNAINNQGMRDKTL